MLMEKVLILSKAAALLSSSECRALKMVVPCDSQNLEVLAAVRVALQQGGWLTHPRVHVHASNGSASPKLTALVTKLGGELMPYAGECQLVPSTATTAVLLTRSTADARVALPLQPDVMVGPLDPQHPTSADTNLGAGSPDVTHVL